jgi:DNA-binding IclR family transcriptional regulator
MAETYSLHDLKHKTIADLREIAKGIDHEAVKGYSQMNKEHLLRALCEALGIDTIEHHSVVGIDKASIKTRMRQLKTQRSEALESGDHAALKSIRRALHHYNHQLRSHVQ